MARKVSDYTRGRNDANVDIIVRLPWSFFGARDIDLALKKREKLLKKKPKAVK
jgi:hypothetical protein